MTQSPSPYAMAVDAGMGGDQWTEFTDFTGFLPGEKMWLSMYYKATRRTGTDVMTLRREVEWWDGSGTQLASTYDDTLVNATVPWTFVEAAHVAPANAVRLRTKVTAFAPTATGMTNSILYSNDFSNAYWLAAAAAVTADQAMGQDGTATADLVVPSTSNLLHTVQANGGGSPIPAGVNTVSVFVQSAGYPRIALRAYDGTAYRVRNTFDVVNGAVVLDEAGTGYIVDYGNGLYRCVVVSASMAAASSLAIDVLADGLTAQAAFAGDGTSGVYLWGAQSIPGSFPGGGPIIPSGASATVVGVHEHDTLYTCVRLEKYQLGSTKGATWGTDVASRPTELTDGRVAAGLSATNGYIDFSRTHINKNLDNMADGSTYARIRATDLGNGYHKLTYGTSGLQIGDARNLPPVRGANLGYKYSGTLSVGTVTTTTAAISLSAGSITAGSATITYNAMSTSITGLSASTTYTYHFFVSDTGYAGGTKTLNWTPNPLTPYTDDAYIYMGSVTFTTPASGTQSGTGSGGGTYTGGGGCVHALSWVETTHGWMPAAYILPGDTIRVLAEDGEGAAWAEVLANRVQMENGYELTSARGIRLRCSASTPLTLRDGSSIHPEELDGHELPVMDDEGFRWEPCTAEFKGAMPVCYVSLGGMVYAAGSELGRSIFTHNITSKP